MFVNLEVHYQCAHMLMTMQWQCRYVDNKWGQTVPLSRRSRHRGACIILQRRCAMLVYEYISYNG